jgi:hypothetical protein
VKEAAQSSAKKLTHQQSGMKQTGRYRSASKLP